MKYLYWFCEGCGRYFKSYYAGGWDVVCACGIVRSGLVNVTKEEYDHEYEEVVKE